MTKAAEWAVRVKQWRASGQRSREFCASRGYSAGTLLWWSSYFRRNGMPSASTAPRVAIARVVRRAEVTGAGAFTGRAGTVVVELAGARVRVDGGADRATVAMVLDVLRSTDAGDAR